MLSSVRTRSLTGPRRPFNLFIAVTAAVLTLCNTSFAEIKTGGAAPPAVARGVTAQVSRGGEIKIPLHSVGPGAVREFKIRRPPRYGRLSAPQWVEKEGGYVIYRHSGEDTATRDTFTFAARSAAGVSAPAEVVIEILDVPGQLSAPEIIDFGDVRPGSPVNKEVVLENVGLGRLTGELSVQAPWRIEGMATYSIRAGKSERRTITLDPGGEGAIKGALNYGQPGRTADLLARIVPLVGVDPEHLDLRIDSQSIRSGTFTIINNSGTNVRAEVAYGSRLKGPKEVEIATGEKVGIRVEALKDSPEAVDETIQIVAEGAVRPVTVKAAAVPAWFEFTPLELTFSSGTAQEQEISVRNTGGERGFIRASVTEPFQVVSGNELSLPPGETGKIRVRFAPDGAGSYSAALYVRNDRNETAIALKGKKEGTAATRSKKTAVRTVAAAPDATAGTDAELSDAEETTDSTPEWLLLTGTLHPSVQQVRKRSAILSWDAQESGTVKVEARNLSLDKDRNLEISWVPVQYRVLSKEGKRVRAELTGLTPKTFYAFRLSVTGSNDGPPAFNMVSFSTYQKAGDWPWWVIVASIIAVILVAAVFWDRLRKWRRWQIEMYGR